MKICGSTLILILLVAVIAYLLLSRYSESFGQDPSVRVGAGWIAGPAMYGHDPVTKFADEIDEMKANPRRYHRRHWGGSSADDWRWELSQSPNLVSQPAGEVGPFERHPPYILKESFSSNEEKKMDTPCLSCMTTEEIERYEGKM